MDIYFPTFFLKHLYRFFYMAQNNHLLRLSQAEQTRLLSFASSTTTKDYVVLGVMIFLPENYDILISHGKIFFTFDI